jgi:hypothetical protein
MPGYSRREPLENAAEPFISQVRILTGFPKCNWRITIGVDGRQQDLNSCHTSSNSRTTKLQRHLFMWTSDDSTGVMRDIISSKQFFSYLHDAMPVVLRD